MLLVITRHWPKRLPALTASQYSNSRTAVGGYGKLPLKHWSERKGSYDKPSSSRFNLAAESSDFVLKSSTKNAYKIRYKRGNDAKLTQEITQGINYT